MLGWGLRLGWDTRCDFALLLAQRTAKAATNSANQVQDLPSRRSCRSASHVTYFSVQGTAHMYMERGTGRPDQPKPDLTRACYAHGSIESLPFFRVVAENLWEVEHGANNEANATEPKAESHAPLTGEILPLERCAVP